MPANQRPLSVFPITTRTLEVLGVCDLTPAMRRVTLGGPQLRDHIARSGYPVGPLRSSGFDDHIKLVLQHPEATTLIAPSQADGLLNWPRHPHLLTRTYTVRDWRPEIGELDIDLVMHGAGPATTWAANASPGDQVQIAGPKLSAHHPTDTDWSLIAGDETALPAIARWLEQWPTGALAQVFIEVANLNERQPLPEPAGVTINWLSRDDKDAGTTTLLLDAVRSADWLAGRPFAWVAGEANSVAPIRRWLKDERSLPAHRIEVAGYWRRQATPPPAAAAHTAQPNLSPDKLAERSALLPAMAIQVAVTLGLGQAFGGQARPLATLAEATQTDRGGLARLLRYLGALDLVAQTPAGLYQLTALGKELEAPATTARPELDGPAGNPELATGQALLGAIRSGTPGADDAKRRRHSQASHDPASLRRRLAQDIEAARYMAAALPKVTALQLQGSITVVGRGAAAVADALAQAAERDRLAVVATPSEIEVLAERDWHPGMQFEPGTLLGRPSGSPDAMVFVNALTELPDTDARFMLGQAAGAVAVGGRVVICEQPLDESLATPEGLADDLIEFASTGGGARDRDAIVALVRDAGLRISETRTVGWGFLLIEAQPAD